ncbi:hypothetical protein CEP54_011112 [Fusarium duplospermum]|uniref:HNH nuclease domain-containing protein n=1 Tax=Fusarium duplospermum TaxID=1325734 RepID=A0A428PGE7_9HYPO|nr:hypothetical protein CEP54_011112 [Fusarium duplospermum]
MVLYNLTTVLPLRIKPNDVEDSTDRIETEPDDYIPDFAEREALIAEWDQLRRSRIPVRYFTPTATGILMVAPLKVLQDLLQTCKKAPGVFFDGVMERLNRDGFGVMENYVLGDRFIDNSWSEENTTPCILAGNSGRFVDTLRIFPRMANGRQRLQSILQVFWGEKAALWITTVSNPDLVESPQNQISLMGYGFPFSQARLAFKPLRSADPNERRLQLHWLSPSAFRTFNSCFYDNPLQHAGLNAENTKTWGDRFRDRRGQGDFETGHVITIRCDNPADLPDWDMLEMQWDLLRVGAIAGAKLDTMDDGTDWLHYKDDGDDEDVEFFQLDQEQ